MVAGAIELFYSYAREDEALLNKLNNHLASFRKLGLIRIWHDREIRPGSVWGKEIDARLQSARIILLLVSPEFIASDYCYGVEVQAALKRHQAGDAHVIPVILRPCAWEETPLGKLQALPKGGKPVTTWANRDQAYTDIAQGIRKVVNDLHGTAKTSVAETTAGQKQRTKGGEGGRRDMARTPQSIDKTFLKKAVNQYFVERKDYQEVANYELGLRAAFQNMLASVAKHIGWSLAPEMTLGKIRPDGVVVDEFRIRRGYWEAKGPETNLEQEIAKKIEHKYPLINTIFEDSNTAILYQNKKRVPVPFNLHTTNDVNDLLHLFFTYVEPDIENFEEAVGEFKERIPEHAQALLDIIKDEHKLNKRFKVAFSTFAELCRTSIDPRMDDTAINEMLIQHLLTERLFRTVFNNPDFIRRNIIASEIEKVVDALASRKSFNRIDFLKGLDRFYVAIEQAAKGIESWSQRQEFLNTVYERFFQGFAVKQADTHGIVYTPQEIVDFMCSSVEEVLQKEFGQSISEPGVQILDPATGTGNFIVNLIRNHIKRRDLKFKYQHDLFCNEIMLLPYYIASLNIEHEYYAKSGEYEPFEGICFADTLELAEGRQLSLFVEENTARVKREKEANIMVVIGNPPYNVGQKNENDNNKNRKYPVIDGRIKETYIQDSNATLKTQLYDAYARFFRWATDRLQGRNGVVCLVTNNSFVDQFAFDGMRKHLFKDFNHIYHLDLHGNVRKNPKLSGTTHNVFGIQIGVGITIAVRNSGDASNLLRYYRVPETWRKIEKLTFLARQKSIAHIDWLDLQPDERHTWITQGLQSDFSSFLALGIREAKKVQSIDLPVIFQRYSGGVKTNRDDWAYDFNIASLAFKMKRLINTYNGEIDKWKRRADRNASVDEFVIYDDKLIKWSGDLKVQLTKGNDSEYSEQKIRHSLYRPFVRKYLYFDSLLNNSIYLQHLFFPTPISETENIALIISDVSHRAFFAVFVTNTISDLHTLASVDAFQCFPYYTYAEDGTNRRENITDWALKQFQAKYGEQVTKWDIFHYVYAILHHPQYRERYAENLKRDLPHIPLVTTQETFACCVSTGKALMELHLNYEHEKEYRLDWQENESVPLSWRVEKMRLTPDKTTIIVNESLTLSGIPPECFLYRLGNRSALEWVLDQYQVSTDKRSGIVSDPNNLDDQEYIVRLLGKVITVSVETVKLVNALAQAVTVEDWIDGSMEISTGNHAQS